MPAVNKIDVRFDEGMYNQINSLASKKHISNSALVRKLISLALEEEQAKESIDFVREQINQEIKATCNPQFDRIAKLIAKIGYQSSSTFYLLAYIMDNILPSNIKVQFDEIKRKSKLMGIAYLKLNESEFYEFMKSEDAALDMLNFNN